jgi:hypothetical protein
MSFALMNFKKGTWLDTEQEEAYKYDFGRYPKHL